MKKLVLLTLTVFALFLFIGSIGAYDNNSIGFGQLLIQSAIAVAIEWFSLKSLTK